MAYSLRVIFPSKVLLVLFWITSVSAQMVSQQLVPPYTCTTTTTRCKPANTPPKSAKEALASPYDRAPPGKRGPKGDKGESCQCDDEPHNFISPLIRDGKAVAAQAVKGEKGEEGQKGSKGDGCKCNDNSNDIVKLEQRIKKLEQKLEEVEKIAQQQSPTETKRQTALVTTSKSGGKGPLDHLPGTCKDITDTTGVNMANVALYPLKSYFDVTPFMVNCKDGGWIVIQRRIDGKTNFYRNFLDYTRGFGDREKEFWIGLETIHKLTSAIPHVLRIEMKTKGGSNVYAEYRIFYVEDAHLDFTLVVGGYSGDAGDVMKQFNARGFTTHDHDRDTHGSLNCGSHMKAGWWYTNCGQALNAQYGSLVWGGRISSAVMKIKPRC